MRQVADIGGRAQKQNKRDPHLRPGQPMPALSSVAQPRKHGAEGNDDEKAGPYNGQNLKESRPVATGL